MNKKTKKTVSVPEPVKPLWTSRQPGFQSELKPRSFSPPTNKLVFRNRNLGGHR